MGVKRIMETKEGTIESINVSSGLRNGKAWTRYAFKIDGLTYSTFNKEIGEKFKVGQFVVMAGNMDAANKYWNMEDMHIQVRPNPNNQKLPTAADPSELQAIKNRLTNIEIMLEDINKEISNGNN